MHTWAPSYNQTLPSIYQIVNGLIKFFFYVDNIYIHTHTHPCSWYAHMYVCPVHTVHFCSLLLFVGTKFSGWFSLQCKGCGGLRASRWGDVTLFPGWADRLFWCLQLFCRSTLTFSSVEHLWYKEMCVCSHWSDVSEYMKSQNDEL